MNKILFSERLANRRKECGYSTQYALAKEYNQRFPSSRKNRKDENTGNSTGILGTIKHYENGNYKGSPKLDIVDNLCKILKCDVDYLLGNMECETHDKQFIHEYTGLSEAAIKRLNEFTTYHQGKIRLTIIDYLIRDIQFSHKLTDEINNYFENYYLYETKKKIFIQENAAERQLDFCDWITHTPSISRQQLKGYENSKDIKHFNVQKEFDNILENFMKQLYDKYSEKSPNTD